MVDQHKKIRFPVIEHYEGNGITSPVKYIKLDDFRARNARLRDINEIMDSMEKAFGHRDCYPVRHWILIEQFNPSDYNTIISTPDTANIWMIGKIIAMGETAFDDRQFPEGAVATYENYVMYQPTGGIRNAWMGSKMSIVPDTNVMLNIDNPVRFVRGPLNAMLGS